MIYGFNKAAVSLPNVPPPCKETVQTSPECTVGLSDPGKNGFCGYHSEMHPQISPSRHYMLLQTVQPKSPA